VAAVRVFLSCAAEELELAERIAAALRSEGHTVDFGVTEDAAENAIHAKIRRTLRRSHAMVFLISPRAVAKDSHARMELDIVEGEWASPAARLIPVMAEETPSEDLPPFLRELKVIRSSAKAELPHELADVLAKVSHDSEGAKTMATRAGFPAEHMPDFKTPLDFWTSIIAGANRGRMRPKSLVEEAARQFPHNAELRTHAKRLDVALAGEVSVIAAGQSVVPRVSYAVDVLARRRRRTIARGIGVAAAGVSLAAAIAWWLVPSGDEARDAKNDTALPGDDAKTKRKTAAGEGKAEQPVKSDAKDGNDSKETKKTDGKGGPDEGPGPKPPAETKSPDPAPKPDDPPRERPQAWSGKEHVVRIDKKVTMSMVKLAGDTFTMGSPKSETDHEDDERQHEATVSGFWIAQTEVTQAQWKAVMGNSPSDCDYGCGDDFPVNRVSWEDAVKFSNALSTKLGLAECYAHEGGEWSWAAVCDGIRLPTEAEWEYAARAGTTTAYSFGSSVEDLCSYGNFADASAKKAHPDWSFVTNVCDDAHANLAPVKTFNHNLWRLYDMHGNVWEWVWDRYDEYPKGAVVDHRGPPAGDKRVLRGGSFRDDPQDLRSADRVRLRPSYSYRDVGFRCVRGLSLPEP
jgi:formylglycine-generating enzyme required for sulfatase activity